MQYTPWMAGTTLGGTIFHGPKPVRAIEVLMYSSAMQTRFFSWKQTI